MMTKTLQNKIDMIFKTSGQGCGDSYTNEELVDKAIQELREEIIHEKNVTKKFGEVNQYNEGKIDMIDEVLAIIGEKK